MQKMGANILDHERGKVEFRVFAFRKKEVALVLKNGPTGDPDNPGLSIIPMQEETPHIYSTCIEGRGLDLLYKFRIADEGDLPDPRSRFQPEGVHGFSQVIDPGSYRWRAGNWKGKRPGELIIYELHTGTFTPQGTFKAITERLDYLQELGVNALELMPVCQTPGKWNWGYDGANLFSVNNNYGTPDELKELIDNCHLRGFAVILDVVYNHFGPEGNYLSAYGPYFTQKHQTAWGAAVNFDDRHSAWTRAMVLDNVRYWLEEYRFDGLRLDAVHAIKDESRTHILQEMAATARQIAVGEGREIFLIAESDENNVKIINTPEKGGYGIDVQWMDDFHHVIHTALTGEKQGYYQDYNGLEGLEKVSKNYLYTGEYSPFREQNRGSDASQNPGEQFVVFIQNHDQVGNRAGGERLSVLVDFPFLKAACGLMFFSPYIPLLFMGEEYAEKNPFLFFTNYEDPVLKKAVSSGRREEFLDFGWEDFPDPEDDRTFYASRLTPFSDWTAENKALWTFYRDIIHLRKTHPALCQLSKEHTEVEVDREKKLVTFMRWQRENKLTALFNLGREEIKITPRKGKQILNSEWRKYGGRLDESETTTLLKGNMLVFEEK
ncbi:MAG: malto-oligosyltrehalose trehalohydrolase [Firmicutes bacterium]|nr:malto-oligosyltrehalose trehalohydrolase [Bacillota bacterium]